MLYENLASSIVKLTLLYCSGMTPYIMFTTYTECHVEQAVEGYTKNQAVKNMPMASRTTVRWGNTAGFTGLVYLVIASSSCSHSKDREETQAG